MIDHFPSRDVFLRSLGLSVCHFFTFASNNIVSILLYICGLSSIDVRQDLLVWVFFARY